MEFKRTKMIIIIIIIKETFKFVNYCVLKNLGRRKTIKNNALILLFKYFLSGVLFFPRILPFLRFRTQLQQ